MFSIGSLSGKVHYAGGLEASLCACKQVSSKAHTTALELLDFSSDGDRKSFEDFLILHNFEAYPGIPCIGEPDHGTPVNAMVSSISSASYAD